MQYKGGYIYYVKVGFAGFVAEYTHTDECADTAAEETHNKQSGLAYTPFVFNGTALIYAHTGKENEVYKGVV